MRAISLVDLAVRAALGAVASALAPPGCAACDAPLARDAVFCAGCAATVLPSPAGDREVTAFAAYGGAVSVALRRLKYEQRPDLARPLGDLLRRAARRVPGDAWTVVPVPLHPRRLAERGYNQAALLARPVARELGARFEPLALERMRNTPQQARLDRERRLGNVRGAFRVANARAVRGGTFLLVDDVASSGATLSACAAALREAGARRVASLVVARAVGPSRASDTPGRA